MAAILTPAPTIIALAPSGRSSGSLVVGLVALIIGFAVLVGSAALPNSHPHSVVIPTEASSQPAAAQLIVARDRARATREQRRLITVVDVPTADHCSGAVSIPGSITAEPIGSMLPDDGVQPWSGAAVNDPEPDRARGTRGESANAGTPLLEPDGWSVRWGLLEMAAAQRGDWTRRCPCRLSPHA